MKHHSSRKIKDHLKDSFIAQKGEDKWHGQEVEVQSDPLIDTGSGRPIILRHFEFKANPEAFAVMPTAQDLFTCHAKQIEMFLWKDGLEPIKTISPRIIMSKKKDHYRIFVTCQAKIGVAVLDKPQTLQDLIKT